MDFSQVTPFQFVAIFGVFCLIIIIFFLWGYERHQKKYKQIVLITGPSGSGKTVLLSKVKFNRVPETFPSLKENRAKLKLGVVYCLFMNASKDGIDELLMDVPGMEHHRLYVLDYVKKVSAIIFVIDSTKVMMKARDIAEYLYDILVYSSSEYRANLPSLLFACTKSDLPQALSPQDIEDLLAKELNELRHSRIAAPDTTGEAESQSPGLVFLGFDDKPFQFQHLENEVHWTACNSVKDNGLRDVLEWVIGL